MLRLSLLGCVISAVVGTGCSGINASKSVSPIDFLLPGLHVQNSSPGLDILVRSNTVPLQAQADLAPQ